MRQLIKKFATIGAVTALFAASALPSFAAQPAVQGCFGSDISGAARYGQTEPADFQFDPGAGWGGFISWAASGPGADGNFGVGGEVNAHQAGLVPDTVIPNTCNP